MVVSLILRVLVQHPWEDAIKLATGVGAKLSWLEAPVIGYFFGESDEKP